MKPLTIASIIAGSLLLVNSCSKKIADRTQGLPAASHSNIDLNAGAWKTILLSRADSFAVAKPAAINSPDYIAEINELKGLQQNLTTKQLEIVAYWSAGSVLRWNEILRGLVAKHNLPPYQLEDGTFPIPNAANPFNYHCFFCRFLPSTHPNVNAYRISHCTTDFSSS